MSNHTTKLTIKNLQNVLTETIGGLPAAELICTTRRRWSCPSCWSHTAFVGPATDPECAMCSQRSDVGIYDLSAQWRRIELRYDTRTILTAIVAQKSVVIAETGAQYALGDPATEFERAARAVLSGAELTRDANGIWRRSDRSRLDGYDHADLALGLAEGVWSAEELARFHGDTAPSDHDAAKETAL